MKSTAPRVNRSDADHLNTPRLITNAAQQAVWRHDNQEPFGNTPPDENPSGLGVFEFDLGFDGQVRDRETGTFYNGFRDCYDPATGRYCQPDPIGTVLFGNLAYKTLGGIGLVHPQLANALYSPQPRYNHPYLYAQADPISFVDPQGLSAGVGVLGGMAGGARGGSALGIPGLVAGSVMGGLYGLVCMAANSDPCAYCYEADKRNMAFCHAMASTAGRRGTKAYANAYRVCIARANQALLECLEDCQKDLKNSGRD